MLCLWFSANICFRQEQCQFSFMWFSESSVFIRQDVITQSGLHRAECAKVFYNNFYLTTMLIFFFFLRVGHNIHSQSTNCVASIRNNSVVHCTASLTYFVGGSSTYLQLATDASQLLGFSCCTQCIFISPIFDNSCEMNIFLKGHLCFTDFLLWKHSHQTLMVKRCGKSLTLSERRR